MRPREAHRKIPVRILRYAPKRHYNIRYNFALVLLFSSEQKRCESDQVVSPDHPGMRAWGLDVGEWDVLGLQPRLQLAVRLDQAIAGAAGNP